MREDQNGFSVIEIIMVVVIVGLIGALGWMFYQNATKSTATDSSAVTKDSSTQNTASKATDRSTSSTQSIASATDTYLTIKEWGVKLPVDSSIADLGYSAGSDSNTVLLNTSKGACNVGNLSRIPTSSLNNNTTAASQAQGQASLVYVIDKHFAASNDYLYEFATGSLGSPGSQGGAGFRPACATNAIVDKVGEAVGGMTKQ